MDTLSKWLRAGLPGLLPNGNQDHAVDFMKALFEQTDHTMRIVTQKLDPSAYGDAGLIAAARTFLSQSKSRQIKILVVDAAAYKAEAHPFIDSLDLEQVKVVMLPSDMANIIDFNFGVTDRGAYRFETDLDEKAGFAAAADRAFGDLLIDLFDKTWNAIEKRKQRDAKAADYAVTKKAPAKVAA